MASKKYTLVMAMLGLMQTAAFAQSSPGSASDSYVFDSSKVSTNNLPQHNDFQKNVYPYPARPKDQWELGGGVGSAFILGDRPLFTGGYVGGITGNLSLRKAISHTFSIRGYYAGSTVNIPHYKGYFVYASNQTHMLGADLVASLNTINYYRGNPKINIYAFAGYDMIATKVKTWHADNGVLGLHTLYYQGNELIGTYGGVTINNRQGWALMHGVSFGGGLAYKINDKFNLAFEQRFVAPLFGNDYLDGNAGGTSGDSYSYSTVRLNMNIGNPATHVQPLWWINPLNYIYDELNKPTHLKIIPILPDADGDGVTDQFDLEPNTPAGAQVDAHGRALDTDGDGVPDYRDKEKLTPQNCFPVNADGVGTCPEPECCKSMKHIIDSLEEEAGRKHNSCTLSSLPSVTFKAGSYKLSKEAQAILTKAAGDIRNNPNCHIKVVGYVTDVTKKAQQLSWDRVNAVIKFLVEKNSISEDRFIFSYDTRGPSNSVDLQPTTEQGPNTVPAPAPNFRSNK